MRIPQHLRVFLPRKHAPGPSAEPRGKISHLQAFTKSGDILTGAPHKNGCLSETHDPGREALLAALLARPQGVEPVSTTVLVTAIAGAVAGVCMAIVAVRELVKHFSNGVEDVKFAAYGEGESSETQHAAVMQFIAQAQHLRRVLAQENNIENIDRELMNISSAAAGLPPSADIFRELELLRLAMFQRKLVINSEAARGLRLQAAQERARFSGLLEGFGRDIAAARQADDTERVRQLEGRAIQIEALARQNLEGIETRIDALSRQVTIDCDYAQQVSTQVAATFGLDSGFRREVYEAAFSTRSIARRPDGRSRSVSLRHRPTPASSTASSQGA